MKRNIFLSLLALLAMSSCNNKQKVVDSISDISIAPYLDGKEAAISFTYDDGTQCHYLEVAPELEKRGFRGTFWIVGANVGTDVPDYPYMTWPQVTELAQHGHEVSNHSWTHPNLTALSPEEVKAEIEKCDSAIFAATGKMPITFCFPYNAFNDSVLAMAAHNRVGTRTFQDAHGQEVSGCTDESLAQWLDSTIANKKWSVTMTHALDYGWDKWNDPQVLWRLYDRVKEREEQVWVGTFAEVASYLQERDHTTLTTEKHPDGVTITPAMSLDSGIFISPLTLKIDGDFADATITATQGDKSLDVVNKGSYVLVNFSPSAGPIEVGMK